MAMTVSMSIGRVAVMHDIRKEISANVDVSLTHRNEILIDKLKDYDYSIEAYTNAKFQPEIDKYNQGKKNCRQIHDTYTQYIAKQNQKLIEARERNHENGINKSPRATTKMCFEYVVQAGNCDTNSTKTADIEQNREFCFKVLMDMYFKYPHIDILLATFHADEPNGTPHMHIIVQFTGEGYKRGLNKQISMSKALELDGFERGQSRDTGYAVNRWEKDVQDTIMTERLHEVFHEEREILDEKRKHDDIRIFRQKAKAEAEALDSKRMEAQEDVYNAMQERNDYELEISRLKTQQFELTDELESLEIDKKKLLQDVTAEANRPQYKQIGINEARERIENNKDVFMLCQNKRYTLSTKSIDEYGAIAQPIREAVQQGRATLYKTQKTRTVEVPEWLVDESKPTTMRAQELHNKLVSQTNVKKRYNNREI